MKYIILTLLLTPLLLHCQSLSENNSHNISFHGKKITDNNIQSFQENKIDFLKNNKDDIKIEGKILSTCPMKGCWMRLNIEKDTILVRFKNYGFFVPKNGSVGKSAIINGKISVDTISVAQLRHYAEDAGKSNLEISQINEPEITISFLADGVIIRN
tara:strand:+ start:337 stop:807 length:471 start_codon:yes stop_codon:yes gene_type:complete